MIVRAYQPPIPKVTDLRLLVPRDGSQCTDCILPVMAALARTHLAQGLLAHVVRCIEMPRRTLPTREDVELADRLVERNRAESTKYFSQLCARLAGDIQARVLVSEHVATTLNELVAQEPIDLVVFGSNPMGLRQSHQQFIMHGTTPLLIMQDVSPDQITLSQAQVAASKHGRQ